MAHFLKRSTSSFASKIIPLTGQISWQPPAWIHQAKAKVKAHPRRSLFILAFLILGLATLWSYNHGWFRRNIPGVAVLVRPPEISPVDSEGIHPQPVIVEFNGSVAPMDKIGKTVAENITLDPAIKGTWTWTSDRQLRFQPESDWPAGESYRISLLPGLLPKFIRLQTATPEFTTPPFAASFQDVLFYINPKDPATRQVTATLNFSHPVALEKLQKSLVLNGKQADSLLIRKDNEPRFTLELADFGRKAYFRSAPVRLPQAVSYLGLEIPEDFAPVQGESLAEAVKAEVTIPDLYNFLKMESSSVRIINNPADDPEQILLLKTATGVKSEKLAAKLSLYLLPKNKPARNGEEEAENYAWSSPAEIDSAILGASQKVPFQINPSEEEFSPLHTVKLNLPPQRRLYVKVEGGLEGLGGFVMKEPYANIAEIPVFPREVRILNDGGVLALSGERKLSILTRAVDQVECRLGKVRPDQINHLVSQSEGNFQNPYFRNYSFGEDNISESYYKTMPAGSSDPAKASYIALNFREFTPSKNAELGRGLFFLNVSEQRNRPGTPEQLKTPYPDPNPNRSGWTDQQNSSEVSDRRFLLITDLGIIVKNNADGTQDVFVQSIETGKPVGGARVEILGKNGLAVAQAATNDEGFASLPRVRDLKQEKAPVAFVVRKGDDLSFLPFNRADRRLDFSRYDIGGMDLAEPNTLTAYLFTERGLYRPGDDVHLGVIVKQFDWKGDLAGLPLELVLSDPNGSTVRTERLKVPSGGFFTWQHTPSEAAPTGMYCASIYLIRDGERGPFLGSVIFRVEEFLPDRMKITAKLSQENKEGWVQPEDLKINVTLQNLYGTPSVDHKINGEMVLSPAAFVFDKYPDHIFFDPSLQPGKSRQTIQEELPETKTDEKGAASLSLNLGRFDPGAYQLDFLARGFEKEGGRSVAGGGKALVSSRPYVVGYKPDGDLGYLRMGSKHRVELLAIQPDLQPLAVDNLNLKIAEQRYISVLTQQSNGNYAYQSVLKEKEISSDPLQIGSSGLQYDLPTAQPGDYIARIYDNRQVCLSVIRFSVVGNANLGRSLEKNAELKVKLSKSEFKPGEEISVSVTAPYTGAGLITIERDKVFASKWFQTSSTSSVQTITVPKDLESNAYVTITFVRALDSKEIFMSPLSSAVVPFRISRENRTVKIDLNHPAKALPGKLFPITYKTDRPSRIIVYAVDEGILQVAKYQLPDPLDHLLQKRSLQVQTLQLLDLILPEYSIVRAAAAAGGDGEDEMLAANLNPFKRKRELPVVFWSGIVNAGPQPQTLEYAVPDYFNGTLRVMAVAVSDEAAGSAENKALIQGPFVIQPNVPSFAAPGDSFDVTVSVANNVAGSGASAAVNVDLAASDNIEIVERPKNPVVIAEGRDASLRYRLKARDQLGNADLAFMASLDNTSSHYSTSLSVRPPVPFLTTIKSGYFEKTSLDVPVDRKMYPQYRKETAGLSLLPLSFARGLQMYLDDYPHLCSEQLTSRAFPTLLLDDETGMALKRDEREKAIAKIINVLRTRQNDQGAFGLWETESDLSMDFPSVYVMHFLTEAMEDGYEVPQDVFRRGLGHLEQIAQDNPEDIYDARQQAYAIYLLTRNHKVTTNYLDRLRDYLQANHAKTWNNDLAALYCAASYAMLQNKKDANAVWSKFKLKPSVMPAEEYDFESPLARSAQYLYLLSIHFPERLNMVTGDDLLSIIDPISKGEFNTYTAAYSILGLHSYSATLKKQGAFNFSILEKKPKGPWEKLELGTGLCPAVSFSPEASALQFRNGTVSGGGRPPRLFYQVVQSGFDLAQPKKEIMEGLQVQREFRNRAGDVVTRAALGEELSVHVKIRALKSDYISNVAVLDLLPGGFEVVTDSVRSGENNSFQPDYVDVREDRVVIYGDAENSVKEFIYKIKATNPGNYQVPPIQAEAMYQRNLQARNLPATMVVEDKP